MASQKHLELLSSGKTLWNRWRQEFADVQALEPDLHEADLRDGNVLGAHLRWADLRHARLCRSNMKLADLSKAIFDEARMSRRDLNGADPDTFDSRETERTEVKV